MDFQAEYRSKLRTPAEAVRAVKNGDWVDYTSGLGFPPLLDAALAARRDELHDVKVRGNLCMGPLQIVECDPEQAHFLYHTWHCSAYERRLCDRGLCYFTPMIFRNLAWYYREFLTVNVAMASVAPMDRHGYFSLALNGSYIDAMLDKTKRIFLEVNDRQPRGLCGSLIHISQVDAIVEYNHDLPVEYVNDPDVICQNDNMISINAAVEVDLFGQVCAESVGTKHMSGSGGQIDYVRGACQSRGGKSFIAFTSTAKGGTISKIKSILTPGAVVTTSKNDVDYIVTEYGVAHLRGRSLGERARQLIAIAHPDFRDELTFEVKKRGIMI